MAWARRNGLLTCASCTHAGCGLRVVPQRPREQAPPSPRTAHTQDLRTRRVRSGSTAGLRRSYGPRCRCCTWAGAQLQHRMAQPLACTPPPFPWERNRFPVGAPTRANSQAPPPTPSPRATLQPSFRALPSCDRSLTALRVPWRRSSSAPGRSRSGRRELVIPSVCLTLALFYRDGRSGKKASGSGLPKAGGQGPFFVSPSCS